MSDPNLNFSTDVTEVVEGLKNSGYASTNGDVVLFGAALGYKLGPLEYSKNTRLYVRLGVLVRQENFETVAVALMLANRNKYGHEVTADSLSLEKNMAYLAEMANSGLAHLGKKMKNFNLEASVLVPELIQESLGWGDNPSEETLASLAETITFKKKDTK